MSDDLNQDIDSLSLLRKDMENLFVLMSDRFEARLQEVESAIEDVEKQVATLVIGYGEQAVFMEALIAQLAFSSPEAQKAFTANVSENRKKMFEAMKEGAPGILGPENEDLASAITNLADQKLSDSN
jgi:hypothetical protein